MTNAYFKIVNNSIQKQFTDSIITEIQKELTAESENLNLYDMIKEINRDSDSCKDFDINTLLKYYVLNQIIKENQQETKKQKGQKNLFKDTANPNIKINTHDNKYYKQEEDRFIKAEEITEINDDGSYILIESKKTSSYQVKKVYSIEDKILSIQLVGPDNEAEKNKWHAAEILGMKREFAQKFKYAGYSGNSSDVIATILNKFTSPTETGLFMDKYGNLFKWSELSKCFIRNLNAESKSPLLTDYEFVNSIVIRKDYTGINK